MADISEEKVRFVASKWGIPKSEARRMLRHQEARDAQ